MLGGLANYDYYVEIQWDLLVFIRLVILPQKSQRGDQKLLVKSSQVKLSFIVIPLHVWTYSGTRCRASQDHGAT